jgi:signal transduction histidine kinase/CheY-like chemotaxis protein
MSISLLQLALRTERDVVQARQRARELAEALGLDNQDQIRLATATSEIARNAFRYARNGKVEFVVQVDDPRRLEVIVTDTGSGISNLDEIFAGRYRSETGLGMGIIGTKRLMDGFNIESGPDGTSVRMAKHAPRGGDHWTPRLLHDLQRTLQRKAPQDPYGEIELQNHELLKTLQELRARQDELEWLNRELEDTNRGVVALYAELDERADYLRRASELKTRFLSNVSHEFRTPLNSIISLARMLQDRIDGDLTSEQAKQVRYIESSARDLQEMVNDLLDLAKVEAGKVRMRPKRFDVHELFSALKGMLKPLLADNTSVDLLFDDTADLAPLHTDEGKVSQILRNLISNAIKFTPAGTVTVSAKEMPERRIKFSVEDTGIGIPREHHENIFREFSQVENPLQERHRGTGLGLPLCRNLALLLGGNIEVQSEPGRGSIFSLIVPAHYVGEAILQEDAEALPAPEFHRAPILYVESDAAAAQDFESWLQETEFQPILARGLAQAQAWTARHVPTAVIINTAVDGGAGWEFLDHLRETCVNVPIIVTSNLDERENAIQRGAGAFLPIPLDRETLVGELRRLTLTSGVKKLLLVDDNEVSRYILRELLCQPWLRIEEASNGREALEALGHALPDALILDLLMPDMSGFDILRELRSKPETAELPVLIYTSKPLTESERTLLESWNAQMMRKDDIATRLSAQPFLEWIKTNTLTQSQPSRESHA